MKTEENKQKRELSDEELKQVTGGINVDCNLPENATHIKCIKTKFPRYEDRVLNVDKKYPEIC